MKIKCQACTPGSRKEHGCARCGGYGYLIEKTKCPSCQRAYWVRPGAYTTYDGKEWTSFDGLLITDHWKKNKPSSTCAKCEEL